MNEKKSNKQYWLRLWEKQAGSDDIFEQLGRSSSSYSSYFLMINDICKSLEFERQDCVLDAGGGVGLTSICLAGFVKKITVFDFSDKIVGKAKELTKAFDNISVFKDDVLSMGNVRDEIYNKIIVGSILQYLDNYEQIKKCLSNFFSLMPINGKIFFSSNPDVRKKRLILNLINI